MKSHKVDIDHLSNNMVYYILPLLAFHLDSDINVGDMAIGTIACRGNARMVSGTRFTCLDDNLFEAVVNTLPGCPANPSPLVMSPYHCVLTSYIGTKTL